MKYLSKRQKYKQRDKVKTNLWGRRRTGTILECINAADPQDIELQGFRYYVRLGKSQHVYSVTERNLWV